MNKKIRWILIAVLIVTIAYLASLSDPSEDESIRLVDINRNVYLITDHNTFSAGSIFAEMFKFYNMGQVIGQATGNLYSFNGFALAHFALPNSKLTYQISSVYNLANKKEEGMKSVEPDEFLNLEVDPVNYIFRNYIDN
ncbi:S41 family peptidase [Mongoliitalea lutea]|uniref:Tail specific protease domain-containing protein n=1 Tax=Mongoliitalea lutea TaxID=849756 RepID=A0A8J3CZ25_9BACT|nr:S41 family peptidase [Mongoliitalea lutea]GHB47331.1 hypothetical protein GCM10008106_30360 [Mongoliitalea lutea]